VLGFGAEPSPVVDVRAVESEHDRRAVGNLTRAPAGVPALHGHPDARASRHAVAEEPLGLGDLAALNKLCRLSLDRVEVDVQRPGIHVGVDLAPVGLALVPQAPGWLPIEPED